MSQNARILNHLKQGKTITQAQAAELFDCWRLAPRIHELRGKGYKIETVEKQSRNARFAQYRLKA